MDRINFTVNGVKCFVGCEVSSDVTLLDYLRNYLELRGTKYMCREGGCGACIVSVIKSPEESPVAVNSVGNKKDGYHPLQKTLAEFNGTQCGYCTPGWIMSMYSLINSHPNLTKKEIEFSLASNICRCTGYRPILEGFKKFAKDDPNPIKLLDIEDLRICKTGNHCNKKKCDGDDDDWCVISKEDFPNILQIDLKDGKCWLRVSTVRDIFDVLHTRGDDSYMLVAGNTAKGAYPISDYPRLLIDISGVSELKDYVLDQNLVIGAGTTLSELLKIFKKMYHDDSFAYLKSLYDHLQLVAHIPVRNIGTIAGNLMIKHQHNEFTSDIFLLFETVGAQLSIGQYGGKSQTVSMKQFLKLNMRGKIILHALLPPLNSEYQVVTHKIMPRAQNAHAIVNTGLLVQLRQPKNVVRQCRIVYSGLTPPYTRASRTEKYFIGKELFKNETLQGALNILEQELVAVENPPEPSAKYRKKLALGLFYKSLLSLCPPEKLNARYQSGATKIHETRPESKGKQIFDTNPLLWPLTKPIQKLEGLIQCSGEAPYTEDLPQFPHEVFASFVLSTEGSGNIVNIDSSEALSHPGVLAFYSAKDIPGLNSFTPSESLFYSSNEEILCSGSIKYFNQPIGIIVAESRYLADQASKLVHATYRNMKKPILDVKEAKKDSSRLTQYASVPATDRGTDVVKVIKGEKTIYHQYHFSMETLVCVTRPIEDGLEVHSATQWMDGTQIMISRALQMDSNSIDLYVRRLGGAFGIKISRSIQVAIACSLVTKNLNRPCRFIQALTTNMRAVGKRFPCANDFEVGVDKLGKIQYATYKLYEDNGYKINETLSFLGLDIYNNVYDKSRWSFEGNDVVTDTPKNTWCRSPGSFEAVTMAEYLLERISYETNVDPVQVRLANVDKARYNDIIEMYESLRSQSDYDTRRTAVDKFNAANRWKKRGLRVSFMRWEAIGAQRFDVNLSVYHGDGTVALTYSAIEMGQGINTKAVQVAAYYLKIPIEKIKIKGNNTIIGPNADITGGSVSNHNMIISVRRCCEQLLARLAPVRAQIPQASWEELIIEAHKQDIDLQAHGFGKLADAQQYNVFGVCLAEAEVDILTGQSEIVRVDLLEDAGQSLSPEIDLGQIEGAFIMGVGYWTSEKLVTDPCTGEILTDRSWNYHVPQARDIPQDFRVYMRKKSFSNDVILGVKAIGEPPICLSVVVPLAIREAIVSARLDSGLPSTTWFNIDGPYTTDAICLASESKIEDFKFY